MILPVQINGVFHQAVLGSKSVGWNQWIDIGIIGDRAKEIWGQCIAWLSQPRMDIDSHCRHYTCDPATLTISQRYSRRDSHLGDRLHCDRHNSSDSRVRTWGYRRRYVGPCQEKNGFACLQFLIFFGLKHRIPRCCLPVVYVRRFHASWGDLCNVDEHGDAWIQRTGLCLVCIAVCHIGGYYRLVLRCGRA